ncbi:MAG: AraC family transcriptional regulator [Stenomitos rutilans HA7619-LM2]|nr:AraC family transcriptional regulator [Stenomitos rutilans HA7619-LM2]
MGDGIASNISVGDHSIIEIALMCGFNNHSHLSKQFRQSTGVTPTAYRGDQQP